MLYHADLHIHSYESFDSSSKPLEIIKSAHREGINLIAVTDHGTIRGGVATRILAAENPGLNVKVIVGAELSTKAGDILGLFLEEEILSNDPFEVLAAIARQGGISIYAHPYRVAQPDEAVLQAVDAVEIYNCRCHSRENLLAQNSAFKFGKPGFAFSDAHNPEDIGRAYTVIELFGSNEQLNAGNFLKADIRPVTENPK